MEIVAEDVEVAGPHGPLLAPTSLSIHDGQTLLVAGDPGAGGAGVDGTGAGGTALALALSGRLRPTRGTVRLNGTTSSSTLRRRISVIDAAGVTEPEGSVSVRDVVAEGLSIAGRPSRKSTVLAWLRHHELAHQTNERFENLPPPDRTRLLVDLAIEAPANDALILDNPDRHGGNPRAWYDLAQREAQRGRAVVVLCRPLSAAALAITAARIGVDNRRIGEPQLP